MKRIDDNKNGNNVFMCMTDIKTLGTAHDAVILQIGMIVAWMNHTNGMGKIVDSCNVHLDWKKQMEKVNSKSIDPQMLAWWFTQPDTVIKSVISYGENNRYGVLKALTMINSFLSSYSISEFWANGENTYSILSSVFEEYKVFHLCPWESNQIRDYKTLSEFAYAKGFEPTGSIMHDALEDAKAQTEELLKISSYLGNTQEGNKT